MTERGESKGGCGIGNGAAWEKDPYQGIASQAAEKLVVDAKSPPLALKRGHIFSDLTARLKSCPSQDMLQPEFFRNLFSDAATSDKV